MSPEQIEKGQFASRSEASKTLGLQYSLFDVDIIYEQIEELTSEYKLWTIRQAIVELDSHIGFLFDEVWSLLFLLDDRNCDIRRLRGIRKSFSSHANIELKLREISRKLEIDEEIRQSVHGFSLIRNCIAHSPIGIGEHHCNAASDSGTPGILLEWRVFQVGADKNGEFSEIQFGVPLGEQGFTANGNEIAIQAKIVKRQKFFPVASYIEFSIHELEEMCFSFKILSDRIITSLIKKAVSKGL